MAGYPWYSIIENSSDLQQGDFINGCHIVSPPPFIAPNEKEIKVDVQVYNVIIITQSCDLDKEEIQLILVCPYWPISDLSDRIPKFKTTDTRIKLTKGRLLGYHLLDRCDLSGFESDHMVVSFREAYAVHKKYLKEKVASFEKRLRLLPPFREHLSQEFARYFMRVGLPSDYHPFKTGS